MVILIAYVIIVSFCKLRILESKIISTNLKFLKLFFVIFFSLSASISNAQIISEDEAYQLHKAHSDSMKLAFNEQKFDQFLSHYFQQLDLIPLIKSKDTYLFEYYMSSGYTFKSLGLLKESVKSYKDFLNYYHSKAPELSTYDKKQKIGSVSYAYSSLGNLYSKLSYLDSAVIQYKNNIKFTKVDKTVFYPSAINNYGLFFYLTKRDLDSALIYFNKAYDITREAFPNHHLNGSIRDNIADLYLKKNKLIEAKKLYRENFDFYEQTLYPYNKGNSVGIENPLEVDIPRLISAGLQFITTSLRLGHLNDAEDVFYRLEVIVKEFGNKIDVFPDAKLEYMKAEELLRINQKNIEKAYQVSKELEHFSDSITNVAVDRKNTMSQSINDLTFERFRISYELEKQHKESEIKTQKLNLWIISIAAISLIGFLIALYLRRRGHIIIAKNNQLIAEQDLELAFLKNKQLYSEIDSKKRDLSDFAINLSQSQEWAKELSKKLSILKQTTGRARKKKFDDFEQELHNKISFDNNTKEFYKKVDELSDSFYKNLKETFPKLSKTDVRLCSLIRLKIDSHEIATLQNITLSSLNTSRYRLRKKLNLSEADNLDDFIQSL